MATPKLQIPNGMQDTLPGECRARRELEERFRRLFQLSGYREIETPILEYYDVLSDKTYGYRPEHVWKTFDSFGHVLAIRPDSTIPCARLAAGALREWPLPLRLFYTQSASNYQSDTLSMLCEQPQAGLELMGEDAAAADAEAISLAVSQDNIVVALFGRPITLVLLAATILSIATNVPGFKDLFRGRKARTIRKVD